MSPKARIFWPILSLLLLADCTTKELALDQLGPGDAPHAIVGSALRFTVVFNPGTAFGFDVRPLLGDWSRPVLIILMIVILVGLARMYGRTAPGAQFLPFALALVCGGAAGNLLDRIRYPQGVVDFIDVGVGAHRFYIFNLADAAITVGALVLAMILTREEQAAETVGNGSLQS